ncbi:uncharacterized protein [Halyomorpha halys]|uniref:uncharacterized protein isoform X2 n=1 Tax=Halyomorpha halys TaxID=286706 RepID=UPI000D0C7D4B|nr:indole-3-acetaldehyde oxidase-like isoform X2 [Halyomorpha halys]
MEGNVTLFVNGKKCDVRTDVGPNTTLLTFLRNHVGLKGTKYMCKEGGCGACVVNYTSRHPVTQEEKSFAVNACLLPILSCQGASITTVEGIGNKITGYNKVQTTLAKFNGTQCGFCSPGMVMNMYSLLSSKDNVTMTEVENSFGGNICRCTGYRSILDAFKSLSVDATETLREKIKDIEDIGKSCQNGSQNCNFKSLKCLKTQSQIKGKNSLWLTPETLEEIKTIFKNHTNIRLVAGNTAQGVYKSIISSPVYIDLNLVPELKDYKVTSRQLELGANMSLSETILLFLSISKRKNFEYLKLFANHIELVANIPIRNRGTLAGNLMIKYHHPEFPSDLFLLFELVKATIIIDGLENEAISLTEMYRKDMSKSIITKIILPALSEECTVETFKIMPKSQNSFALINAGFLFLFDDNFCVKEKPSIIYGNINSNFVHATKTENYFAGKNIFKAFKAGVSILSEEMEPNQTTVASSVFKKQLALNLLYKFVLHLKPDQINLFYQSGGVSLERPLSQALQSYETKPRNWPLTKPIHKLEAVLQCSGEALYVNDIPELSNQMYGALVLATQANSTIKRIDPSPALAMDGVVAFFSANDIPGKNICCPPTAVTTTSREKLFCSGKVLYSGQPVGIIIAKTEDVANTAAQFISIDYIESQEELCLTIKDVLKTENTSRINHFSKYKPKRNINFEKLKYKVEGEVEMGPQYHFTMEPQSCLCNPTEDGINIFASTQWMSCIQGAVSKVLNIPENSINMEVKRIGGGFGSKITRASLVATACALAAYKLNCPVKVILDIETNMKAIGKRNASYSKYEAGFDDTGYIEWLKVKHYSDEGCYPNDPAVMLFKSGMVNCYDSSGWEIDLNTVSTSTPSSSWMRAPGTLEGMAVIEELIEHISFVLKKDPLEVRLQNIKESSYIRNMIGNIKESSSYQERKEKIQTFNKSNRWKKRGISLIPMSFDVYYFFCQPSMVSIYGYDGTVSITHGGVEMGQGINTKAVQICASTLGIDESKIKVKSSSVLTSPNAQMSGASITSDNVVYTTMKACEILNERLEPIKKQMKDAKWEEIIAQANADNIHLNASYMNKTQDEEIKSYCAYGVAVTEVELDVLTGQYQILRTDILQDAGESINPEIDIGQVEGGFVMGLGYFLTENIIYDPKSGLTLTHNTSNYWVPGPKDIPSDFRVTLLKNAPNPYGVVRSKATGEPPVCLALSAVHALKNAIMSARKDCEENEWLSFSQPFSVEKVCQATKTSLEQFKF